jgi:Outer membrane lipoprotein carrier protein LolA-like
MISGRRASERVSGWLLAVCCAGTIFAAAPVARAADRFDFPTLMQAFAKTSSAEARFTERRTMSILKKPLDSSGVLRYTAPDRLEKHTLQPADEMLLVERDQITLERAGRKRVLALGDYPALWALVESMRGTLAGDAATLTRFYEARLDGSEARWVLTLVPREPRMSELVATIRLTGRNARIEEIDIFETGGDRTSMTIDERAR